MFTILVLFMYRINAYVCVCFGVRKPANALVSMDCLCVCVRVCDCPFACECSTLLQAEQRSSKGAQILGISKTSLASVVTMAKAAGGTPVFESALYSRQVHCIHQLQG